MELQKFESILRCGHCWAVDLRVTSAAAICRSCGASQTIRGNNLFYSDAETGSPEWQEMQAGSVSRYHDETYNVEELPILELFGCFISVGLPRDAVVLDIGCGPFRETPPYVAGLGLKSFLALEPLPVSGDREFPCLVGAIAESIPLADASVDAAIFATSLDHIEDEDKAIAEVKRILKPGGHILFWQGLYEPEMMASSKTFAPIFNATGPKRLLRIAAAYVEYAVLAYRMHKRAKQLRTGERIDNAHCRYYTMERFDESLERWELRRVRRIPVLGTASMFVEARP